MRGSLLNTPTITILLDVLRIKKLVQPTNDLLQMLDPLGNGFNRSFDGVRSGSLNLLLPLPSGVFLDRGELGSSPLPLLSLVTVLITIGPLCHFACID